MDKRFKSLLLFKSQAQFSDEVNVKNIWPI
jgi:hypothetical protein